MTLRDLSSAACSLSFQLPKLWIRTKSTAGCAPYAPYACVEVGVPAEGLACKTIAKRCRPCDTKRAESSRGWWPGMMNHVLIGLCPGFTRDVLDYQD